MILMIQKISANTIIFCNKLRDKCTEHIAWEQLWACDIKIQMKKYARRLYLIENEINSINIQMQQRREQAQNVEARAKAYRRLVQPLNLPQVNIIDDHAHNNNLTTSDNIHEQYNQEAILQQQMVQHQQIELHLQAQIDSAISYEQQVYMLNALEDLYIQQQHFQQQQHQAYLQQMQLNQITAEQQQKHFQQLQLQQQEVYTLQVNTTIKR